MPKVKKLTNQQAFDISARHLLKQGRKSGFRKKRERGFQFFGPGIKPKVKYDFHCKYRGPHGRMCALGPLYPDDLYEANGEDWSAYDIQHNVPALANVNYLLLEGLQDIHDNSPPRRWKTQLGDLAYAHGLDDKVVHEERDG